VIGDSDDITMASASNRNTNAHFGQRTIVPGSSFFGLRHVVLHARHVNSVVAMRCPNVASQKGPEAESEYLTNLNKLQLLTKKRPIKGSEKMRKC
jgi:hypothetical protein